MDYPPDAAWPANPPRADLYCEAEALMHPLVSPITALDWKNAPPMFFGLGEEMLRDEDAVLAKRLHAQGVTVRWREFEAMPHCFAMMLDALPASKVFFQEYTQFCSEVVERKAMSSDAEKLAARTLKRQAMQLDQITELTDEEVTNHMKEGRSRIEKKHGAAATEARPML